MDGETKYQVHDASLLVDDHLEQTALANPHATVRYFRPRQAGLEF